MLGLGVTLFPQFLLRCFLADDQSIATATLPLQLAVAAHVLDGYGKVLSGALIGAGASQAAMRLTLLPQWLLLLPLLALSVLQGYGLAAAMGVFLASSAVSALLFVYTWHRERWASIQL